MRFLCLHGTGSNSRILQQQTAAIRYELGNRHSYDFVEGSLSGEADPALEDYMLDGEEAFSYGDLTSPESCLRVAEDLERYVATEGPYDGIMGFSVGATIAISWMLKLQRQNSGRMELPFKVGIFFSHTIPMYDLAALDQGRIVHMDMITDCLDVPTAHIWGVKDTGQEHVRLACRVCKADKRSVYVHGKGHGISTSVDDTIGIVKMINRAITLVEG